MNAELGSFVRTARAVLGAVGRTVLPIDANRVPRDWTHVTKVDPELEKRFPILYPLYLQHTDAVSVGGSSNVSGENTEETFELLTVTDTPAFHEPSEARHVTERTREMAQFLAIPEVLNGDSAALVGTLGEGIEYLEEELIPELLDEKLPPVLGSTGRERLATLLTTLLLEQAVFEAYIIQNPDSAAARRGGVSDEDVLDATEARQRAIAADRHLHSEILYVEYSGTFGGDEAVELLSSIDDGMTRARLWYGGGIDSRRKARQVLDAGADTLVVGDVFHDIAEEEQRLVERAENESVDPTLEATREWVEAETDLDDSAAVRYLSTIPSVPDPERLAVEYHAKTLTLYLDQGDGATADGQTTREFGESALERLWGATEIEALLSAIATESDRRTYLQTLGAEVAESEATPELPAHHLSSDG